MCPRWSMSYTSSRPFRWVRFTIEKCCCERSGGIACGGRKGTGEGICCSCVFLVSLWHARSRRILRDREPRQSSGLPAEAHDASVLVHMAAALSVTALPFGTRGLQSWAFRPFCHRCFFLSFLVICLSSRQTSDPLLEPASQTRTGLGPGLARAAGPCAPWWWRSSPDGHPLSHLFSGACQDPLPLGTL